jgi:hypothetical protein
MKNKKEILLILTADELNKQLVKHRFLKSGKVYVDKTKYRRHSKHKKLK